MAAGGDTRVGSRIGLDLDNTIVCYDELFGELAAERGLLPASASAPKAGPAARRSKRAVRDALCAAGRERDWTALQGEAYGPRMKDARPFDGALEFVGKCRRRGVDVSIVSHRTRRPYRGAAHDLHAAASGWLERHGLTGDGVRVFLEPDRESKAARIAELGCTHFVDDLADFLSRAELPASLVRVHFDASGEHGAGPCGRAADSGLVCVSSWAEIATALLGVAAA